MHSNLTNHKRLNDSTEVLRLMKLGSFRNMHIWDRKEVQSIVGFNTNLCRYFKPVPYFKIKVPCFNFKRTENISSTVPKIMNNFHTRIEM